MSEEIHTLKYQNFFSQNLTYLTRESLADQKDAGGNALELNSADWPVARLFVYSANTDDLPCTD